MQWTFLRSALYLLGDAPAPVVPEAPGGANYLLPISAAVVLVVGGGLVAFRAKKRAAGGDEPDAKPTETVHDDEHPVA